MDSSSCLLGLFPTHVEIKNVLLILPKLKHVSLDFTHFALCFLSLPLFLSPITTFFTWILLFTSLECHFTIQPSLCHLPLHSAPSFHVSLHSPLHSPLHSTPPCLYSTYSISSPLPTTPTIHTLLPRHFTIR